jgi:hypothetical protein
VVKRKSRKRRSLTETFSDNAVMDKAVCDAVKAALELHRRARNKVAVLRNGKVVRINPRKILV